jgi:hypothetical protein
MAYNEFTLDILKQRFGLQIDEGIDIFSDVPVVAVSDLLRETLRENVSLALAISTEKARSELIITPILLEIRRQLGRRISFFSGVEFTVDPDRGLKGTCDYLLSLSAEQLTIEAPVVAIVEAKNENIKQGISQCIAELLAAQLFNQQRGNAITSVYGAVTTGSNWKFLRLADTVVAVDLTEYYIPEVEKIVGIMVHMIKTADDSRRVSRDLLT